MSLWQQLVMPHTPTHHVPYKQKYWQTLYLTVCSNTVGGILNCWISVLYGEKAMPVVPYSGLISRGVIFVDWITKTFCGYIF